MSRREKVRHLGGECSRVLEQECVSSVAVEHEDGVVEVLHCDVGRHRRDHYVVHAVGVQHGLLDRLPILTQQHWRARTPPAPARSRCAASPNSVVADTCNSTAMSSLQIEHRASIPAWRNSRRNPKPGSAPNDDTETVVEGHLYRASQRSGANGRDQLAALLRDFDDGRSSDSPRR